jgi:hypothetical protein
MTQFHISDFHYMPSFIAGREAVIAAAVSGCLVRQSWIFTGVGGMGKTTVATAVLRDPYIQDLLQNRCYTVFCHEMALADTSRVGIQLQLVKAILRSMHLNDRSSPADLPSSQIAHCFGEIRSAAAQAPTLLFLDNMETLSQHTAAGIEELLSRLADIPNVVCLVTSRDKSVRPRQFTSVELPSLTLQASWSMLNYRLAGHVHPDQIGPLGSVLEAMDGHPLSIVLLAAYAQVNSVSAAITGWTRGGTAILRDRDSNDKYGSLAASVELSLDSIDPAKDSAARSLLLFLSSQIDGFPSIPEGTMEAFSRQHDPEAIHKLSHLSLVFVRQGRAGDGPDTYRVLQPISQYMVEQYKELALTMAIHTCRGFLATHACLGKAQSDYWLHDPDDQQAKPLGRFQHCICEPVHGSCIRMDNTERDNQELEAFIYLQSFGNLYQFLSTAARHFEDGELGVWEFGAFLLNLTINESFHYSIPSDLPDIVYAWLKKLEGYSET